MPFHKKFKSFNYFFAEFQCVQIFIYMSYFFLDRRRCPWPLVFLICTSKRSSDVCLKGPIDTDWFIFCFVKTKTLCGYEMYLETTCPVRSDKFCIYTEDVLTSSSESFSLHA